MSERCEGVTESVKGCYARIEWCCADLSWCKSSEDSSTWCSSVGPAFGKCIACASGAATSCGGCIPQSTGGREISCCGGGGHAEGRECTYRCCAVTCRCLETSRRTNRTWITAATFLCGVMVVVTISLAAAACNVDEMTSILFDTLDSTAQALLVISCILGVSACGLVCSANCRSRIWTLMHLISTTLLIWVQLALCIQLSVSTSNSSYDNGTTSYLLAGWNNVVTLALGGDQEALEWLTITWNSGDCCGWTDATDVAQNPPSLGCDAPALTSAGEPATCAEYFKGQMSEWIRLANASIVASVFEMALIAICCGLVCRLKKHYTQVDSIDRGDVFDHLDETLAKT